MDRREDEGQYYPGGKVIPTRPVVPGGSVVLDDEVTETSPNGVKSSGIWSFVHGIIDSLTIAWENVTGKPTAFPPQAHGHADDSWFTSAIEAVKTWAGGLFTKRNADNAVTEDFALSDSGDAIIGFSRSGTLRNVWKFFGYSTYAINDADGDDLRGKYVKPTGGIPKTDLASAVQDSLSAADAALPTTGGTVTGNLNVHGGLITLIGPTAIAFKINESATSQTLIYAPEAGGEVQIPPRSGIIALTSDLAAKIDKSSISAITPDLDPDESSTADIMNKLNSLITALKGTTAALAVIFTLGAFGAVNVQTAKLSSLPGKTMVVTNVTGAASQDALTGKLDRGGYTGTAADLEGKIVDGGNVIEADGSWTRVDRLSGQGHGYWTASVKQGSWDDPDMGTLIPSRIPAPIVDAYWTGTRMIIEKLNTTGRFDFFYDPAYRELAFWDGYNEGEPMWFTNGEYVVELQYHYDYVTNDYTLAATADIPAVPDNIVTYSGTAPQTSAAILSSANAYTDEAVSRFVPTETKTTIVYSSTNAVPSSGDYAHNATGELFKVATIGNKWTCDDHTRTYVYTGEFGVSPDRYYQWNDNSQTGWWRDNNYIRYYYERTSGANLRCKYTSGGYGYEMSYTTAFGKSIYDDIGSLSVTTRDGVIKTITFNKLENNYDFEHPYDRFATTNELANAVSRPQSPITETALKWRSDRSAIVVSVAASGTLGVDLTGWTIGQTQTALITLAAGSSVSDDIILVGYNGWITGSPFVAECVRVGNKIYVNPVCAVQ